MRTDSAAVLPADPGAPLGQSGTTGRLSCVQPATQINERESRLLTLCLTPIYGTPVIIPLQGAGCSSHKILIRCCRLLLAAMKKIRDSARPASADAIARLADQGKDVSRFFEGRGRMVQPIQRVNVDVTAAMLQELDKAAQELNVSRQALDQHYLAQRARQS